MSVNYGRYLTVQDRIDIRAESARAYFKEGYNCAQAVVLAFADLLGDDKDRLAMMASSFGGGMGRMRLVCGAVSGMLMVEGMLLGYSSPSEKTGKIELYANVRSVADRFACENGSLICAELLSGVPHTNGGEPEQRTPEYYKKRPCDELVASAAGILARHLVEQGVGGV